MRHLPYIKNIRVFFAHRTILRAHAWQTAANYTQQIGGMALGIFLARLLLPEDFGDFAYASALAILCSLPLNWSLSQSLLATRCEELNLVRDAWNLAGWVCCFKLVMIACLFVWFALDGDIVLAILIGLNGLPLCVYDFINLLRVEVECDGNFKPHFYSSIATLAVVFLVTVPLAFLGFGSIALSAGGLPLVFFQWLLYRRSTKKILDRSLSFKSLDKSFFREGAWIWLTSMSDQALFRLDKLFLGNFAGADALGNYNRAYGYAPLSHLALSSLYTNPTIASLGTKSSSPEKLLLLGKCALIVGIAGTINALFWIGWANPLVVWLFGSQWETAIPVFKSMAGLSLCLAVFYLPTTVLYHRRSYACIGLTRVIGIALFSFSVFLMGDEISATKMAYSLQMALIVIGLALTVFALKELKHS